MYCTYHKKDIRFLPVIDSLFCHSLSCCCSNCGYYSLRNGDHFYRFNVFIPVFYHGVPLSATHVLPFNPNDDIVDNFTKEMI